MAAEATGSPEYNRKKQKMRLVTVGSLVFITTPTHFPYFDIVYYGL